MLRHFLVLLCLDFILFNSSYAADDFEAALIKITPAVNNAGIIDYKTGASSCPRALIENSTTALLYSKDNDQKIELTVLSEDDANALFSVIAGRKDIPFGYLMDGSYARAHKVVRLLEQRDIIAGKAFIEGKLFVDTNIGEISWAYHVAPVVMIRKNNKVTPYIFDPSIFTKPVPYEEWKTKITSKSKSEVSREYYTNRFVYDPEERNANNTDYSPNSLRDMDTANRNYNRMLAAYSGVNGHSKIVIRN